MSLRANPRSMEVARAKSEITMRVLRLVEEAGLTNIEYLQMLTELQASTLKYMLRAERHPDSPDDPADLE